MSNVLLLHGKSRDIGGMIVHRTIPDARRRHVGPFVFLDHMGPIVLDPTHKLDVRPHPHIGLSTVTYLFEGRGFHRDSLGSRQEISPGDLNLMVAGRGIVHSERTPPEVFSLPKPQELHGVQIWMGLPVEHEDCDPHFSHWPRPTMPDVDLGNGLAARLLIGQFGSASSPVPTLWRTLFMDVHCETAIEKSIRFEEEELGFFVVQGRGTIEGQTVEVDDLAILEAPRDVRIAFEAGSRFVILGGRPFPEPRHMWWNFVSSQKEKIHAAAAAWSAQRLGQVPDETEFIPLPQLPLP